jgi:hypothetical protein
MARNRNQLEVARCTGCGKIRLFRRSRRKAQLLEKLRKRAWEMYEAYETETWREAFSRAQVEAGVRVVVVEQRHFCLGEEPCRGPAWLL